jgi:hypothetical protein
MFLGLPVICYGVSYNRTTTEGKALYFKRAEDLAEIIRTVKLETLLELAKSMKEIADRRYTWKVIADKYNYLVEEALRVKRKISVAPQLTKISEQALLNYNAAHLKHQNYFFDKR